MYNRKKSKWMDAKASDFNIVSSYNRETMILRKVYDDKEDYNLAWECFKHFLTPDQIKISVILLLRKLSI